MPYEIYTPKRSRVTEPTLRVDQSQNRICLSKSAREMLPKACTHVLIGFDRSTRKIALIATGKDDPKAVRITNSNTIAIGKFGKLYRIADDKYLVHAEKIENVGAIVTKGIAVDNEDGSA